MKSGFKFAGGPGIVVTAAFIGPGTVTVCTLAGVNHGFSLLWAMLLSLVITFFFQYTAAKISVIKNCDLIEVLKLNSPNAVVRQLLVLLIVITIIIGNAAYEAGNILGGAMGAGLLIPHPNFPVIITLLLSVVVLSLQNIRIVQSILTFIVFLMSLTFLVTAIISSPDITLILRGLFTPTFDSNEIITVLGIVGTTVVPYNLFLHARLAKNTYGPVTLRKLRINTVLAIFVGGIISFSIIISAASFYGSNVENAIDMAQTLSPVFGSFSKYLFGIGLFCAGVTSAITAPMASGYVLQSAFPRIRNIYSYTLIFMIFIGGLFAFSGIQSIILIRFAQVTNALLLPVLSLMLLLAASNKSIMGVYSYGIFHRLLLSFFVLIIILLGFKGIYTML